MSAVRPGWARLFRIACSLIRQVNSEQLIIDSWSFGGGTAMNAVFMFGGAEIDLAVVINVLAPRDGLVEIRSTSR